MKHTVRFSSRLDSALFLPNALTHSCLVAYWSFFINTLLLLVEFHQCFILIGWSARAAKLSISEIWLDFRSLLIFTKLLLDKINFTTFSSSIFHNLTKIEHQFFLQFANLQSNTLAQRRKGPEEPFSPQLRRKGAKWEFFGGVVFQ